MPPSYPRAMLGGRIIRQRKRALHGVPREARSRNAAISEHAVNELKDSELIEERFEGEDYRLIIVANKFQTGFDQPLLAGMFLDSP